MKRVLMVCAAASAFGGCSLSSGSTVMTTGYAPAATSYGDTCMSDNDCRSHIETRIWMPVGGAAFAPPAFYPFCQREDRLCDSQTGEKRVALDAAREREIEEVNASVNRRIRQRSDLETTGKADDWRLPTAVGDCEDFAILKKSELIARGWPAAALLITVARHRHSDEGHTVLTVATSKGDLILDNLDNRIRTWSATPYRYFARQSQLATGQWERIGARSTNG